MVPARCCCVAAGGLNAVAGGGSFLTFPALVYAGVPPIVANATSAFAVTPGYVGGAIGFRQDLKALDAKALRRMCVTGIAGGVFGGLLLTLTPASIFNAIVPGLLLLATAIFVFGQRIVDRFGNMAIPPVLGVFVVSTYGGYFNGGVGIVLLALFGLLGMTNLPMMNGLKNLLSLILSAASLVIFASGGLIVWPLGILMAVFAMSGGYAGARISRGMSTSFLRLIVVATGLVMSAVFLSRVV